MRAPSSSVGSPPLEKGLGELSTPFLPCKDMTFLSTGHSDKVLSWKEKEPLQTLSLLALWISCLQNGKKYIFKNVSIARPVIVCHSNTTELRGKPDTKPSQTKTRLLAVYLWLGESTSQQNTLAMPAMDCQTDKHVGHISSMQVCSIQSAQG